MTTMNASRTNRTAGAARKAVVAGLTLALTLGMFGCGAADTATDAAATDGAAASDATTQPTATTTSEIRRLDTADMFTERDTDATYDAAAATTVELADGAINVSGAGATSNGSTVTITEAGTYVLTGTLADGQVVVDAADDDAKVQLVLAGASVTSTDGAALYVASADKVFLTVAEGTTNTLATSGAYAETDEGVDGAIFAKDDLTVNGAGSLAVTSAEGHGIVGNDDVKLCLASGATLSIDAAKSAVNANDSVRVTGEGAYTLAAGTDGVHVENTDDAELGYIYIDGGTFDVTAGSDGFDASYIMQVDGGDVTVAAGDDGLHAEADLVVTAGTVNVTESYEALEGARIGIDGGDISATATDDGLNATGDDNDNTTGDVGFGAGEMAEGEAGGLPSGNPPSDGEMPEGMEPPTGADGEAGEPPSGGMGARPDDAATGENGSATDGTSTPADTGLRGGRGGMGQMGGAMMDADSSALIQITGGTLYVSANGDGIDSNGAIAISGGDIQVDGPVNTGNGALDSGSGDITITGGTLLATSAGGMEENASGDTTQPTFLASLGSSATGTVTVTDASGNVVASWESAKQFNAVIVSSAALTVGETYTVTCGDASVDVTLDDTVTGEGNAAGGFGGGMGGEFGGGADMAQGGGADMAQGGRRGPRGNGGGPRGQQTTDGSASTSTDVVSG